VKLVNVNYRAEAGLYHRVIGGSKTTPPCSRPNARRSRSAGGDNRRSSSERRSRNQKLIQAAMVVVSKLVQTAMAMASLTKIRTMNVGSHKQSSTRRIATEANWPCSIHAPRYRFRQNARC
jgi:hypothetical protein